MQCPVDGNTLVMSNREGVEIDYCPTCRGVWLDRGELDKIVERSAPATSAPVPSRGGRDHDDEDRGYDDDRRPRSKRRGSFLGDIFDF